MIGKPLHFPAELRVLISIANIVFLVFKSILDFEFHFTLFTGAFIRSVTGVEESVLNEAFANFLQVGELRANQMTFINTIISYLSKNGTIDKSMLYKPPFTDQNDQGIDGVFDIEKKEKVVKIIDQTNYNAIA